ncbi:hypothetical protein HU200_010401 [Digitaria exilis]|uniref:Small auxin up regulated protein n=1 Tax=Digitaria exilis TaxID=1010633 RepID=A0A835FJE9_9POAL|nr:hypothetical protein HU200_010401 [Digitaria exilis]
MGSSGTPRHRHRHAANTRTPPESHPNRTRKRVFQHHTRSAHGSWLCPLPDHSARVVGVWPPANTITHRVTGSQTKHCKLKCPLLFVLIQKERPRFKEPTMISAKRIAQLAMKWQRMAAHGRKRLTWGAAAAAKEADECSTTSVASRGHCAVYTADGARFEVPVACLGTAVFAELLRMSREEFGFAGGDGRITLPCDAAVMEYTMCLLRRGASAELEEAFLCTMAMPCRYASRVVGVPAHVGASRQVAV